MIVFALRLVTLITCLSCVLVTLASGRSHVSKKGQALIDSLLSALPYATRDTQKINLLNAISFEYSSIDIAQGLKYGEQALSLASRRRWTKGMGKARYSLGNNFLMQSDFKSALAHLQEALRLFEQTGLKTEVGKTHNAIATLHLYQSESSLAAEHYKKALIIFQSTGNKYEMGYTFGNLGKLYSDLGDLSQGLSYLEKALEIGKEFNDKPIIAHCAQHIGNIKSIQGDHLSAMKNYREAVRLSEELGNNEGMHFGYQGIGYVMLSQKNFLESRNYFIKALDVSRQLGSKQMIAGDIYNIGIHYYQSDNVDSAVIFLQRAHDLFRELGDNTSMAGTMSMLAAIYSEQKKFSKAYNIYKEVIPVYEKLGHDFNSSILYGNAAKLLVDASKDKSGKAEQDLELTTSEMLSRAVKYLDMASVINSKSNRLSHLMTDYETYAEAFELIGSHKKSNEYLKKYHMLKDSIHNQENIQAIAKIREEYETEKKEKEIKLLNKDKVLQSAILKNTQKNRNMIIAALLGVLTVSGVFFYWRNKHNKLAFQNQLTETELSLFRSQMNPHFMFNALNSIHSYVMVNEKKHAVKYLQKFAELMRLILENSTSQLVTLADDLKALDLYLELEAERLGHKFSYEIKVQDNVEQNKVMVPPLLLQPFLENSIWHGMQKLEEGGIIQLHVNKNGKLLECVITDNGKGFQQSSDEDQKTARKSYGINITKQRIENLNRTSGVKGYCHVMEMLDGNKLPAGVKVELALPLTLES